MPQYQLTQIQAGLTEAEGGYFCNLVPSSELQLRLEFRLQHSRLLRPAAAGPSPHISALHWGHVSHDHQGDGDDNWPRGVQL